MDPPDVAGYGESMTKEAACRMLCKCLASLVLVVVIVISL